jgi:hypothetical protein
LLDIGCSLLLFPFSIDVSLPSRKRRRRAPTYIPSCGFSDQIASPFDALLLSYSEEVGENPVTCSLFLNLCLCR